MYRAVVIVAFIMAVSADDDLMKCGRIFHPNSAVCCPITMSKASKENQDLKECFDIPMKPFSCDREDCLAKKLGLYASDGSVDMDVLLPLVEKDFENNPEALTLIKDNCINGDTYKYGPQDMCDIMKVKNCIQLQALRKCTSWNDKAECRELKDLVEECAQKVK